MAATVALGVAVSAYWFANGRRVQQPAPPVTPLGPTVTARVSGGQAEQTSGKRQDFALVFDEQIQYSDGRTVAKGLVVTVARPEGRSFVITGREGTVGSGQSSVEMTGDVVLKASDGLVAKTATASYSNGEGILRAPGPVAFERAKSHGTGVGFTYDKRRDTMSVLDQAVAHVAGNDAVGDMEITAGAFTEARRDRYMRLDRQATVTRPGQTFAADDIMVYLLPERDEPDSMELRGNASISGGTGFGSLRAMQARDINLDYADDGRTVEHVTLAGQAVIALAGATPAAPGQQLAAEFVDLALGPDGAITSLVARDALQVSLPADGATARRTIRADELTGDGVAGAGLTAMRFTGNVDFREGGTATAAPTRLAKSATLTLALAPSGAPQEATFGGNTTFEDQSLRATAADARYLMAEDRLVLIGRPDQAPRVTDTGLQVEANDIAIGLATNAVSASGAVSSVMQPASARGGEGTARTPALLADDQPLFASAGALEYDSQSRRATYSGRARLWQGPTDIRAEEVVLDEQRGDLTASGGVTSTLNLAAPAADTPGTTPTRGTIARGQTLHYDDLARTATYATGAQMSGPAGDLKADRITLVLAAASRTLERIEGEGAVEARVAARDAVGARLTYHADEERYVLTGSPVRFTENCRVTTGRTLTFFGTAGKLIVDGNEAARTVTTGGGRCEPQK